MELQHLENCRKYMASPGLLVGRGSSCTRKGFAPRRRGPTGWPRESCRLHHRPTAKDSFEAEWSCNPIGSCCKKLEVFTIKKTSQMMGKHTIRIRFFGWRDDQKSFQILNIDGWVIKIKVELGWVVPLLRMPVTIRITISLVGNH